MLRFSPFWCNRAPHADRPRERHRCDRTDPKPPGSPAGVEEGPLGAQSRPQQRRAEPPCPQRRQVSGKERREEPRLVYSAALPSPPFSLPPQHRELPARPSPPSTAPRSRHSPPPAPSRPRSPAAQSHGSARPGPPQTPFPARPRHLPSAEASP